MRERACKVFCVSVFVFFALFGVARCADAPPASFANTVPVATAAAVPPPAAVVVAPAAVPSVTTTTTTISWFEWIVGILNSTAVGAFVAGLVASYLLTVNSNNTKDQVAHRQSLFDMARQYEGMVVHAFQMVDSNETLNKLPYEHQAAQFVQNFNSIFQNIFGRIPTAAETAAAQVQAAPLFANAGTGATAIQGSLKG